MNAKLPLLQINISMNWQSVYFILYNLPRNNPQINNIYFRCPKIKGTLQNEKR